jgi:VWFA-related protein
MEPFIRNGPRRRRKHLPAVKNIHRVKQIVTLPFVVALIAGGPFALAQTDGTQANPSLTVNARLVVLDVVVTDANGKPVDNLTENDFQVFEDGVKQRIRSVEPPSAHVLPAASLAGGAAQVFDPSRPASFGLSPVTLILLDEANTHFADSSFARRQIHDYLAKQPALLPWPANLMSVYDGHFKQLQQFTRDRDALLKALASAPTEYAWKLEINGSTEDGPIERLDQSLHALEQIAQDCAPIPGRKNLIWVGGGFPTLDPTMFDGNEDLIVRNTLRHVTDVLLNTRITLYAVDPTSSAAGLTEITDPEQLAFAQAAGDALSGGIDPFSAAEDFDRLGPVTGGRVVRGKNDVSQQIANSIDLGANFYTLAYTPSSAETASAKYRKIKVVVLRSGLTATTRNGYYPNPASVSPAETASYDLSVAAESALPLNALHLTVLPDDAPDAPRSTYIVRVRASDLQWKPEANGESTASVYVLAASMNAKKKMIGYSTKAMKATAKSGTNLQDLSHFADFVFTAPASAKAASLRFVVRDSSSGKMGSQDIPLD